MDNSIGLINPHLLNTPSPTGRAAESQTEGKTASDTVEWSGGYDNGALRVKSPFATTCQPTTVGASAPVSIAAVDIGSVPAETHSFSHKLMGAVALGLTGFGVVAGMVAMPQPAFAQTISTTQVNHQAATATATDNRVRTQTPVNVQSVQQAVDKFDKTHQLYVVGQPALNGTPLTKADMARYAEVLKKYPNAYVVLVDKTTNVQGDDMTLSRGIGNSAEFQGVVNPKVGERDGVVVMIYHNVNGDQNHRKIFMRAESLPDKLGVGEAAFAAEDGTPGPLLNDFINAFKNEGKDIPGSLEVVLQKVDGTIDNYVQQTVGQAEQNVQAGHTALDGLQPKVKEFQGKYGSGGSLGSPDVAGWQKQMARADEALGNKDFQTATTLSTGVVSAVRTQETAMANYGQAPAIAQDVQKTLNQVKGELGGLSANGNTTSARTSYQTASQEMESYNTAYKAKDPSFQEHLQKARGAADQATKEVSASKSETETIKNVKLGAAATVTLAVLAVSIVMNRRAAAKGRKAQTELDEALKSIGDKSNELMKLLNNADFHEIAGYEGKTKELADQLRENTVQALTLVGGASKFVDEAQALVHPHGAKALQNLFLTRNYNEAIELLTDDNKKLSFSFNDSSRAVMEKGSKAETWRQQLIQQGTTREFQKSLKEVLLAMADSRDAAEKLLGEIETKGSEINGYIEKVQKTADTAQQKAQALQTSGPDGLFTAPAVTGNLMPMVVEKQNGLLDKGRALAARNFVEAWDNYATPAERMSNEASQIVDLGTEARKNLVPTVANADKSLNPNGVKTEWAHDAQKQLSDRLNDTANKALRTSVATDVETLGVDVEKLQTRVTTAVAQDKERREVSPGLIEGAEQDVDTARKEIAGALKQAGAFKAGTPEQVLRETKLDPTDRTKQAHVDLEAVKGRLDVGDVDQAGEHLQNVKSLSTEAHKLVADTRQALKDYPATLDERQKRTDAIGQSIPKTYTPALQRIKATYAPEVLKKVAPEVNAGDTIGDNIDQSLAALTQAGTQTKSAIANFDKAALLTSRDDLNKTDVSLKDAQAQLDGITKAEQILADRQKKAEADLSALQGRFSQTHGNANAVYVRSHARSLLSDADSKLGETKAAVQSSPKDPYRADQALKVAENVRTQVEQAIDADHRAYDAARSAISQAQSSVVAASASIASAQGQSWHWSNAQGSASESVSAGDLAGAYAAVATAQGYINSAEGQLNSQDYEAASSTAQTAENAASSAAMAASSAVSSARSRFDSQVSRLESLQREADRREEERRAEERREEERREEAARQSSSGSSGGSFGGGGGSGSRGGDF